MEKESSNNLRNIDWLKKDRITVEKSYVKGNEYDCSKTSNSFVSACFECTKLMKFEEFTMPWHRTWYYRIMSCKLSKKNKMNGIYFFKAASLVSSQLHFLAFAISRRYINEKTVEVLLQINFELFFINMNIIKNLLVNYELIFDPRLLPSEAATTNQAIKEIDSFYFDKLMVLVEQNKVQWVLDIMKDKMSTSDISNLNNIFNLELEIPGPNKLLVNDTLVDAVSSAKNLLKQKNLDFQKIEHRITVGFCVVTILRFPGLSRSSNEFQNYVIGPIKPS